MEFFRQACTRPRVFNESYVRCHQNQGLKLVRYTPPSLACRLEVCVAAFRTAAPSAAHTAVAAAAVHP
ncbi:hypothetical protein SPRG_04366 [Saprolegnia parasitica CBS 223.65]|uniref:Uncharacterized protein n=1 Tax=Saprolegnia parasitica (strain CBS 223.65) TaxID=695850 RepID=A0A067CI90_SAPPC|nr:hypothetical protein SPRG_04366 [Saprolegnia parasitica CBS 223.65]KDO30464.1 hypothetical protein SPRG_04366 [Saprolegnia parasitica CBS 223.65]|eukprot:XP_012198686.1 hypothetical protein SPRG_04366 [Saprolegnia parasitica CBS 223.65]